MNDLLTPGAKRALDQARELADEFSEMTQPRHLLLALFTEENAASAALRAFGVSRPQFESFLIENPNATAPMPPAVATRNEVVSLDDVLEAAKHALSRENHQFEMSSEHLLIGLTDVSCEPATFLIRHGIDRKSLEAHFYGVDSSQAVPLPVDFQLGADKDNPSPLNAYTRADAAPEPVPTHRPTVADRSIPVSSAETTNGPALAVLRIIDAAANRFREGIRTLEDFTRFVLDDAELTGRLKHLRHDLTAAVRTIDQRVLLSARDTDDDVGTSLTTSQENQRAQVLDVVVAACKRTQEAARSLEEYGKVCSAVLGATAKQVRYELYSIEKNLIAATPYRPATSLHQRALYLLVSESTCRDDWKHTVTAAIAGGTQIIQLREKQLDDAEILKRGHWLREVTRAANVLFIMNDRPDLAVLTDADGVHVGQQEIGVADARRFVGNRLVGVSTHSIRQARQAVRDGADYIGVGPCFPSSTKSFATFPGIDFVSEVAAEIEIPWFAIGGVNRARLVELQKITPTRVAVAAAICGAEDVRDATAQLADQLNQLNPAE